jgi:hypothetical protein
MRAGIQPTVQWPGLSDPLAGRTNAVFPIGCAKEKAVSDTDEADVAVEEEEKKAKKDKGKKGKGGKKKNKKKDKKKKK